MSDSTLSPSDLAEDRSGYVKAGVVSCLKLGLLGIIGRLASRRLKRRRLDTSDYLIILGAVCATCEASLIFASKRDENQNRCFSAHEAMNRLELWLRKAHPNTGLRRHCNLSQGSVDEYHVFESRSLLLADFLCS